MNSMRIESMIWEENNINKKKKTEKKKIKKVKKIKEKKQKKTRCTFNYLCQINISLFEFIVLYICLFVHIFV